MDFYTTLSKYYDIVFPLGEVQQQFFRQLTANQGINSALDVACGTGTYTLDLVRQDLQATGVDLSPEMIELAKDKAAQTGMPAEFRVANMLELPPELGKFDLVICIGNSLVHLLKLDQIEQALQGFAQVLKAPGTLVLQIVNYDRVLDQHLPGLPMISRPEAGLTFERIYHYRDDGLIDFASVLTVDGESWRSSVPLLPLRRGQLEELVQKAGLQVNAVYGGFNGKPLTEQAQALVLVAHKE